MNNAQEVDGDNHPLSTPVCNRCGNSCPTCFRCELSQDEYREMETLLAPGDIIVDCNKYVMREYNEKEPESRDVSEGVHGTERRLLPDGVRADVVEWKEDEESGEIHIRVRRRREVPQGELQQDDKEPVRKG